MSAVTKIHHNNATPKPTSAEEYCECSRCGTIYPTIHFPDYCPGCAKRRTYKDRYFDHNPFGYSEPTVTVSTHTVSN